MKLRGLLHSSSSTAAAGVPSADAVSLAAPMKPLSSSKKSKKNSRRHCQEDSVKKKKAGNSKPAPSKGGAGGQLLESSLASIRKFNRRQRGNSAESSLSKASVGHGGYDPQDDDRETASTAPTQSTATSSSYSDHDGGPPAQASANMPYARLIVDEEDEEQREVTQARASLAAAVDRATKSIEEQCSSNDDEKEEKKDFFGQIEAFKQEASSPVAAPEGLREDSRHVPTSAARRFSPPTSSSGVTRSAVGGGGRLRLNGSSGGGRLRLGGTNSSSIASPPSSAFSPSSSSASVDGEGGDCEIIDRSLYAAAASTASSSTTITRLPSHPRVEGRPEVRRPSPIEANSASSILDAIQNLKIDNRSTSLSSPPQPEPPSHSVQRPTQHRRPADNVSLRLSPLAVAAVPRTEEDDEGRYRQRRGRPQMQRRVSPTPPLRRNLHDQSSSSSQQPSLLDDPTMSASSILSCLNGDNRVPSSRPVASASSTGGGSYGPMAVGMTPLYRAVSYGSPLHVVRSIVESDPSSLRIPNGLGMVPLHAAIERYDTPIDVLRMLVEADPTTASYPLRRNDDGLGGLLFGAGPSSGSRRRSQEEETIARTPVDLLWRRFVEPEPYRSESVRNEARRIKSAMVAAGIAARRQCRRGTTNDDEATTAPPSPLATDESLRTFWDLMSLFLQAAHRGTLTSSPRWRAVHASVDLGCDPLLVRFASALHPEQLQEKDEGQGRLPLHVAAAADATGRKTGDVERNVRVLADLYPSAASCRDADGRLPLSLALESGRSWSGSVRELFRACPESIAVRDAKTGMLPFMIAAVGENSDLDCVYGLLREDPLDAARLALSKFA